ncbi:hypothetical protein J6590_054360 [Homalodisca vitripennis]|nr:hypothetical protein J6590_054360 [Homalodisca vitripennis]
MPLDITGAFAALLPLDSAEEEGRGARVSTDGRTEVAGIARRAVVCVCACVSEMSATTQQHG